MAKELTEKDLIAKGFTGRNISRLNEVLIRHENSGETLSSLIEDLSKRFYAGVLCLLLVLSPLLFLPVFYPASLLLYYLPVAVFGIIAVWYLIPLGLSWKAHNVMKDRQ